MRSDVFTAESGEKDASTFLNYHFKLFVLMPFSSNYSSLKSQKVHDSQSSRTGGDGKSTNSVVINSYWLTG